MQRNEVENLSNIKNCDDDTTILSHAYNHLLQSISADVPREFLKWILHCCYYCWDQILRYEVHYFVRVIPAPINKLKQNLWFMISWWWYDDDVVECGKLL